MDELEKQLLSLLRGENSSLTVSFNDHACNYTTVAEAVADGIEYEHSDWASAEEMAKAIATNRAWNIHWYPDTPIGFHAVVASTLAAAVEAALRVRSN